MHTTRASFNVALYDPTAAHSKPPRVLLSPIQRTSPYDCVRSHAPAAGCSVLAICQRSGYINVCMHTHRRVRRMTIKTPPHHASRAPRYDVQLRVCRTPADCAVVHASHGHWVASFNTRPVPPLIRPLRVRAATLLPDSHSLHTPIHTPLQHGHWALLQ